MTTTMRFLLLFCLALPLSGWAVNRSVTLTVPSQAYAGQAFMVTASASTDATDAEQIGFFHGMFSYDNGASWHYFATDVNAGKSATRNGWINTGAPYQTIIVVAKIAFRGGAAGDVDYNGNAINWGGSWDGNQSPPAKIMTVSVVPPPNQAPTITWTQNPASAWVNQWFVVQARGNDANGNLSNVWVWRDWVPHAFMGGGNGWECYSDPNGTSKNSPGSLTFQAQSADSSGATSPVIYHTVTVPNRDPSISIQILDQNQNPITLNGSGRAPLAIGRQFFIRVSGSDPDGRLSRLYSRLDRPGGVAEAYPELGVSGTNAANNFGPYTANQLGIWNVWGHVTDLDAGGYQWQGGGWWGSDVPDVEVYNTAPGPLSLSVAGTTVEWNATYGHYTMSSDNALTVTSTLQDQDGNLTGHTLRYQDVPGAGPVEAEWEVVNGSAPTGLGSSTKQISFSPAPGRWDFNTFGGDWSVQLPGTSATVWVYGPTNGATFVSQMINGAPNPTSLTLSPGQTVPVKITLANTGQKPWSTDASPHRLGSQSPQDNTTWGLSRVSLGAGETIVPTQNKMFEFNITAPTAPGAQTFQWRMLEETGNWFGATTPAVTITVANVAPTVVSATGGTINYGQTFTTTVRATDANADLVQFHLVVANAAFATNSWEGTSPDGWKWRHFASVAASGGDASRAIEVRDYNYGGAYPMPAGTYRLTLNAQDSAPNYAYNAGSILATLAVNKATPTGSFANRSVSFQGAAPGYALAAADLNATFANPYSGQAAAPGGAPSYSIVSASGPNAAPTSGAVAAGTVLKAGTYVLRATYGGDANYNGATVDATFTVLRNDPPTLTFQVLDGATNAVLAARQSVGGVESGAASATIYFGQPWKLALAATDFDENASGLYLRFVRPGSIQGTNPSPAALTWSGSYYYANLSFTPAASLSWVSPEMLADQVGTWNLWAHSSDAAAAGWGAITPWTGDEYGWQTVDAPDLVVAKAVPSGTFADRTFGVPTGSSYTLQASDLNAVFKNPYTLAVAAPGGAVSYADITTGTPVAISAGSILAAGFRTIRASYGGDGNYEPATVTASFAIGVDYLDADIDGMADNWESLYGVSNPTLDPDGDGMSNLDEYKLWRNPMGADAAYNHGGLGASLTVLAKGTGSVTLNIGGTSHQFNFSGGGSVWSQPVYGLTGVTVANLGGGETTIQASSSTVSDYFVKIDVPAEVQRHLRPTVTIDGKFTGGIAKGEITPGGSFKVRVYPGGLLPFGTLSDDNLSSNRLVEFGFGGGRSGRSAGRIMVGFGSWHAGAMTQWHLQVMEGEALEGSHAVPNVANPTHYQAKVPSGYVDMVRERHSILVRYYNESAAFVTGTFRNFTGVTPVAEYRIDLVPGGTLAAAPTPNPLPSGEGGAWSAAGLKERYAITRKVGGISHVRELETHWFWQLNQNVVNEPGYSHHRDYYATVSRLWPWRVPSTPRGGFTRLETKAAIMSQTQGGGAPVIQREPIELRTTSYLGTDETSAVGDYSFRNSDGYDFWLLNAVAILRGLGADQHEVPRRLAYPYTTFGESRLLRQRPVLYDNGLGGGTYTEYLSYAALPNQQGNLAGYPVIALGEPRYIRQNFGDDPLLSSTDLVSTYQYHTELIDGLPRPTQVTNTKGATTIGTIGYSYLTGTFNGLPTLKTTTAEAFAAGAGNSLVTATLAYSNRLADPDLRGKPLSVIRPDGTKSSFAYQRGTLTGSSWVPGSGPHLLVAELSGRPGSAVTVFGSAPVDPLDLDLNRSLVIEKITDIAGRPLREARYVYQGGNGSAPTFIDAVYSTYDIFGQLVSKADQPTIGAGTRVFYEATYTGFQKQWERDENGIAQTYRYDDYNRVQARRRVGAASGGFFVNDTATVYTYDGMNRLASETRTGVGETDRLITTYTYDTASRPKVNTAPGGLVTSVTYDSLTQKTIALPGGGTRIEVVYKDARPKATSGSAGPDSSTSYAYDASGNLVTTQVTAGQTVVQTADWAGRVMKTQSATYAGGARLVTRAFNTLGQLEAEHTTVNGIKVALSRVFQYDGYGRLYREGLEADGISGINPSSDFGVKEYEDGVQTGAPGYASNLYLYTGLKVWPYAGTNAGTARYLAQRYTQLTGHTASLASHVVSLDFDRNKTDATSTLTRAQALLETTTTVTGSSVTLAEKRLAGLLVSSTNAQGQTVLCVYDGLGRLQASDHPRVGTTTYDYVTDTPFVYGVMTPDYRTTWTTYDNAGRVKSRTDNAGKTAWFQYDGAGNVTHVWGDTTNPVRYEYNDLGQKTKMRTYRSGTWSGATLPDGFSGDGDVTHWNYQAATGLLLTKVDDFGQPQTFEYDDMNRVKKRTDARGWITNYTYTAAGQPWTIDYTDGVTTDVVYEYDRAGRVLRVDDAVGRRQFSYYDTWSNGSYEAELRNKSGRLQAESFVIGTFYGSGRTVGYDYQYETAGRANGPLAAAKVDNGASYQVGYAYDAFGRLATATYGSLVPFTYTYVPDSNLVDRVTQVTGASTFNYRRDYDHEATSNRLQTLKHQWSTVTAAVTEARATYDGVGRRNTEKVAGTGYMAALNRAGEAGVHQDFTYTDRSELDSSARYQLTGAWGVGGLKAGTDRDFTYDPVGNRTADIVAGVAGSYSPNDLNQYTSAPGAGSLTYDQNGNMTADGTRTYAYDGENRLRTVTQAGTTWTYTYDYLGRRVRKVGPSLDIRYLYDGWNLIAEINSGGTMVRKFAWGLDVSGTLQGAGGVGGLLAIEDVSGAYYPLYDAAHNVIGLYNGSGGIAAAYEFDPFGNLQTSGGSYAANNPFRFSTKYTDTETTLTYYGHRYYHSKLGRFINRDPIAEEGGINLYGFCGNDGVNRYDYLGLSFWDWLKSVFTGGSSSSSSTTPDNTGSNGNGNDGNNNGDSKVTITPGHTDNIYVAEHKETGDVAIYEYDPATGKAKLLAGFTGTGSEVRATHDAWDKIMDGGVAESGPSVLQRTGSFIYGVFTDSITEPYEIAKAGFTEKHLTRFERVQFATFGTIALAAAVVETGIDIVTFGAKKAATESLQTGAKAFGKNLIEETAEETVDLYRAVGVREFGEVMTNQAFKSGGNSMSARQFALKLEEAIKYADTDLNKVAILKTTVPQSVLKNFEFSTTIDPFIFKSGVVTVQPEQLKLLNQSLQAIEHVF